MGHAGTDQGDSRWRGMASWLRIWPASSALGDTPMVGRQGGFIIMTGYGLEHFLSRPPRVMTNAMAAGCRVGCRKRSWWAALNAICLT